MNSIIERRGHSSNRLSEDKEFKHMDMDLTKKYKHHLSQQEDSVRDNPVFLLNTHLNQSQLLSVINHTPISNNNNNFKGSCHQLEDSLITHLLLLSMVQIITKMHHLDNCHL